MALIIDGIPVEVPADLAYGPRVDEVTEVESVDYIQDSRYRLHDRGQRPRRTRWIRGIVLHTRMGIWPAQTIAGGADRHWDEYVAGRWERRGKSVGAHIAIDGDGSYACMADIVTAATYHAGQVNEYTVGIEIYQEAKTGYVYEDSLRSCVMICDVLTRELGIQRQFCIDSNINQRFASPVARTKRGRQAFVPGGREGRDFVGLYGHRNVTRNRGKGDPGEDVWNFLRDAGYEGFCMDQEVDADRDEWSQRQEQLGMDEEDIDGIPGPKTRRALEKAGCMHGLWVSRPGD